MTVACQFVTGIAGTGKTHEMRRRIAEDAEYGVLSATTGIAAVNLNTITVNSLLGFFDADSLGDAFVTGRLTKRLVKLAEVARNVVVDEVSMMHAETLDTLYTAVRTVNEYESIKRPLGLVLTGDFAQLPPIPTDEQKARRERARFAFEANCWEEFEPNIMRLDKVWRQTDERFLKALNAARRGEGEECALLLKECGVRFTASADLRYDGTTIYSRNDEVNKFNDLALARLPAQPISVRSWRTGVARSEWKNIPEALVVKENALVMLLANAKMYPGCPAEFVNGDCGHVVSYDAESESFDVRLLRNDSVVTVGAITRANGVREEPEGIPYTYDRESRRYIIGQIRYIPIRLAYASTVHKTQGLTLDRVQIDVRGHFFSNPHSVYVALSRARSPEHLRVVGTPELLGKRCRVAKEVTRWL